MATACVDVGWDCTRETRAGTDAAAGPLTSGNGPCPPVFGYGLVIARIAMSVTSAVRGRSSAATTIAATSSG